MIRVLAGAPLHPAVMSALHLAATRMAPEPVDTRALLVALMQADMPGDWSRIRLHAGDTDAIAAAVVHDPASGSSGAWEDVPITDTCAVAIDIGGRLAGRYNLWPLPAGLLALGLLADETSAAARASDAMERTELLGAVQSDVLGTSLDEIDSVLPAVVDEARRAHYANTAPPWPNTAPAPPPAATPEPAPYPHPTPPAGGFATGQMPAVGSPPPVGTPPHIAGPPAGAPQHRARWRMGPLVAALAISLVLVVLAGVLFAVGLRHDSSATAKSTFDIDKLRTLDVCALLDSRVVAAVGPNEHVSPGGDWGSCGIYSTGFDVEAPSLHLSTGWFDTTDTGDWEATGDEPQGFPILRERRTSPGFCTHRIDTAGGDGLEVGVLMLHAENSDAACAIVQKAVPLIIDRLVTAAQRLQVTPGSLQTVDPCELAEANIVHDTVGEPSAANPAHGVHDCRAKGTQTELRIALGLGQRPDVRDTYQNFVPFDIAGRTAFEIPVGEDAGPPASLDKQEHACQVRYMYRPEPDETAEIAAVRVDEATGVDHATACRRAKAVLASIIPKLPGK